MRLIDADALKEWIDEYVSVFKKSDTREIKGYVEHQPTIDAIPIEHINLLNLVSVVRCKECKHREEYPCKVYHDDDWFCADGERRES